VAREEFLGRYVGSKHGKCHVTVDTVNTLTEVSSECMGRCVLTLAYCPAMLRRAPAELGPTTWAQFSFSSRPTFAHGDHDNATTCPAGAHAKTKHEVLSCVLPCYCSRNIVCIQCSCSSNGLETSFPFLSRSSTCTLISSISTSLLSVLYHVFFSHLLYVDDSEESSLKTAL